MPPSVGLMPTKSDEMFDRADSMSPLTQSPMYTKKATLPYQMQGKSIIMEKPNANRF